MSRAVEALVRRHDELNPHAKGRWDLGMLCGAVGVRLMTSPYVHKARIRFGSEILIEYTINGGARERSLSIGHELGHLLIHAGHVGTKLFEEIDEATVRIGTTAEEEALAEYCGQLLWRMIWRIDEAEKERSK